MNNGSSTSQPTRVVVLGLGYAGLIATNRFLGSLGVDERQGVSVTVVNPTDVFVERVRLHQLAAGSLASVTRPVPAVLHPAADVVLGRAEVIDPERKVVHVDTVAGRRTLPYDHLVYSVGSSAASPVPGARQHAFLLGDLQGAAAAREAITAAGRDVSVLVVGGGFTGVEAAAEIAEQQPEAVVTLVSAGPLVPVMRPKARSSIRRTLRRLGVALQEGTPVVEITDGYAVTGSGGKIAFDVCVIAASFDVPDLAQVSGLEVDAHGRLRVDETLRSLTSPAILGAGDAVAVAGPSGRHLRMACSVAVPMGGHVAEVLLATLRGEPAEPFDMGFAAQCVSLGRRRGYIQPVRPDDSPRGMHVGGALGARIKEAICTRVVDAPVAEQSTPGTYTWRRGASR